MISLISYKPNIYRAFQKDVYLYLTEQAKSDMYTEPREYLQTLMRVRKITKKEKGLYTNLICIVYKLLEHRY